MANHRFIVRGAPVLTAALIAEVVSDFQLVRGRAPVALVVHPARVDQARRMTGLAVRSNGGCLATEFWLEEGI